MIVLRGALITSGNNNDCPESLDFGFAAEGTTVHPRAAYYTIYHSIIQAILFLKFVLGD